MLCMADAQGKRCRKELGKCQLYENFSSLLDRLVRHGVYSVGGARQYCTGCVATQNSLDVAKLKLCIFPISKHLAQQDLCGVSDRCISHPMPHCLQFEVQKFQNSHACCSSRTTHQ